MEGFTVATSCNSSPHQRRPPSHTNLPIKPCPLREPHLVTSPLRPSPAADDHRLGRLPEDKELSIFDAERYFKEGQDQMKDRRQKTGFAFHVPESADASSLARRTRRSGTSHAILTTSSAASWSSQSSTSSDPPRPVGAIAVRASVLRKLRRGSSSSCRWPVGVNCPCSGKKAVNVEEKLYSSPRSPGNLDFDGIGAVSLTKKEAKASTGEVSASAAASGGEGHRAAAAPMEDELCLRVEEMMKLRLVAESWISGQDLLLGSFAMPFSDGRHTAVKTSNGANPAESDEPTRDSLEVFRPAEDASATLRRSVELRWATRPLFATDGGARRSYTFPVSPMARVSLVDDELASDSSSDLFEIESFSAQATPRIDRRHFAAAALRPRPASEEAATPTTAATAFSGAASEHEDGGRFSSTAMAGGGESGGFGLEQQHHRHAK